MSPHYLPVALRQDKDEPQEFDCDKDYANYKTKWSAAKKKYCCKNKGKACEEAHQTSINAIM